MAASPSVGSSNPRTKILINSLDAAYRGQVSKLWHNTGNSSSPVALLVLLAAAAGARIVASHLLPGDCLLGAAGIVAAQLQSRQFLVLLALDIAREVLHGALGGLLLFRTGAVGRPRRDAVGLFGVRVAVKSVLAAGPAVLFDALAFRIRPVPRCARGHLHEEEVPHRLVFDAIHQRRE